MTNTKKSKKTLKIVGIIFTIIVALMLKSVISDFLGFRTTNNKLKYEKCLHQDISTVYDTLATKHGSDISDIQKLLPSAVLNDFVNCACNSYVYGNPFVSKKKKTRMCQHQVVSKNIWVLTSVCEQNIKDIVFDEYKKQNAKFGEKEWNTKYANNVAQYCICLVSAKESVFTAVEHHLLDDADIIKSVEEYDLKCVQKYLKDLL